MNPAACARAKKAARLAAEEAARPTPLPLVPEDPYRTYRKHTRPFRRAFRGIISRRDAERFVVKRAEAQARAIKKLEGQGV